MKNKHLHIVIATTLSAILLWVSVNMSTEYQIAISVPLQVENIPAGKAIAVPIPKYVQLKLRGTGWRCAALFLGSSPKCILDVSSIPPTRRGLVLADIVDRTIIPIGILVTDMKPESVLVGLDNHIEKRVRVGFNLDLAFRSGYGQVGQTVITPESVTIGGGASLLGNITVWPTAHSSYTDLKSAVDAEIPLADYASHYLTLSPSVVHVSIDVQQFAEKTIAGLPVEARSVPLNKEVILIPPKIDLIVRGGVQQLATLNSDSFFASIDYSMIITDSTGYADPRVVTPKGVQLVNMKPDRMQFIIRTRL